MPVGVMRNADALDGFERHFPPAVVFAMHAHEPPRKPLRGKGVAGSGDFRLAGFAAPQANKPPIDAQHDPASIPLAHTAPHHKKTIISIV